MLIDTPRSMEYLWCVQCDVFNLGNCGKITLYYYACMVAFEDNYASIFLHGDVVYELLIITS